MLTSKVMLRSLFVAVPAASAAAPPNGTQPQTADAVAQCVENHVQAQTLRRNGRLLETREKLISCSRSCPNVVQSDCIRWLGEVEDQIPSVVVRAKKAGKDLIDARLTIDGKPTSTQLDGREIALDPGPHTFRIEYGGEQRQQEVLLVVGEQGRSVVFAFGPPPAATSNVEKAPARVSAVSRPVPASVYVTGGVTIAALGAAAAFAAVGKSNENNLMAHCAPNCTQAQFDDLQMKYQVADVGFGVAVAGAITTLILYQTRPEVVDFQPSTGTASARSGLRWDAGLGASPGTGTLEIRGRF